MIRIAIVEDDPSFRRQLQTYLAQYQAETGQKFLVTAFPDGMDIVENYQGSYDIILMDIEMQSMDGMTAAERIRAVDPQVVIIFITNMGQYAIRGYAVEALDYVLKPISYYAFSQRIQRALGRMERRVEQYVYINAGRSNPRKLKMSDLRFVEVQGHTLMYHTSEGVITASGTMSEVEKSLDAAAFFRCNKGYLVNLSQVDSVMNDMAMVGGEPVQISRAKKKAFLDALNNYINEVSK